MRVPEPERRAILEGGLWESIIISGHQNSKKVIVVALQVQEHKGAKLRQNGDDGCPWKQLKSSPQKNAVKEDNGVLGSATYSLSSLSLVFKSWPASILTCQIFAWKNASRFCSEPWTPLSALDSGSHFLCSSAT